MVAVDDGSGDGTGRVLERWSSDMPNLRALTLPTNAGPATARNRAIDAASGEVVLFVDDDIVAPRNLARLHLELHAAGDDPMLGVLGRVDWHPDLRRTRFMRWLDHSGLQFGYDTWLQEGPVEPPASAFYTCNLSMRRALLDEVGGFDERFPFAAYEDIELAWRLARRGFRLEYRPVAVAWHARAIDLATFRSRMARVAESAALLAAAQPDFPLDESTFAGQVLSRRDILVLRAKALVGRERARNRWYWAELRAGYAEGRARAGTP